jgi:hypothetical protein
MLMTSSVFTDAIVQHLWRGAQKSPFDDGFISKGAMR